MRAISVPRCVLAVNHTCTSILLPTISRPVLRLSPPYARLPCDQRCSRKLACGHRCPGLCGEECPSQRFCVDPACLAKADSNIKDQVRVRVICYTLARACSPAPQRAEAFSVQSRAGIA